MENDGLTDWRRLGATLAVYLLALGVIFVGMAHYGQLLSPYLEHDDWDSLLSSAWGKGYASPWQKTLSEGRWVNYWWFLLVGQHWSAAAAARAYLWFAALFACLLSWRVEGRAGKFLLTLVLFFSPVFAELSVWPATLASSMLLLCLAMLAFLWLGRRGQQVGLGLFTFLLVMSYAGAAPIVLLAYVYLRKVERPRELAVTLAIYLAAYALSVLGIATLNDFYHGHFGLVLEGWRKAHPPHDIAGLWTNGLAQLEVLRQTFSQLRWPCLIAVVGALLVYRHGQRRLLVSLLLVAVLAFSMDMGLATLNGTQVPFRAMGWLWVALVLPVLLMLGTSRRVLVGCGWLGLLCLLQVGVSRWNAEYRVRRDTGNYIHDVGLALAQARGNRPVVLVGDPPSVPQLQPLFAEPSLQLRRAWQKEFGLRSEKCQEAQCQELAAYAHDQHIGKLIFPYQGVEVVYFRRGAVFP